MIAMRLHTIIFLALVMRFPLEAKSCVKGRTASPAQSQNRKEKVPAMSPQEASQVKERTDCFIGRFRETLDFGVVFDEMFVTDSIRRLRKGGFFQGMNVSPQLIEELDDPALTRLYKAFMNYYYLKAAHDLSVGENENTPPEVLAALKSSKFSNLLSNEGSGDSPIITTRQQLDEFVTDLSNIAASYRAHLSPSVFDSSTYKASLKAIHKEGARVQVKDGYETLGVERGMKVYEVEKDMFIFFLVEENGKLKVLTLGMGK